MKSPRKTIRYQGKIANWKDEQGFGFVTPNGGGALVFVHIKSFTSKATRPVLNDVVTDELSVNDKGQPRANNVALVRDRSSRSPSPSLFTRSNPLVAAAGFLGIVALLVTVGKISAVVFGIYVGMSALTLIAYAVDKSAAENNRWRTEESTLHMLALAGGWPGALMAQHVIRHKSKKQSFQKIFWFTVAINCALLGWLLLPSGRNALHAIFGAT